MLHGLSGVLCFFLLVLVVRLCKKSKSKKRNYHWHSNWILWTNATREPTVLNTISESATTVQVYRPLESEYDEIDVKQQHLLDNYERQILRKCNPAPTQGTSESSGFKKDNFRVQENTARLSLCANISDFIDLDMKSLDKNADIDSIKEK